MIVGIYETVLYCADIASAVDFYTEIIGLRLAKPSTEYSAVFRISPECMLILFNPEVSKQEGRGAPAHGTVGAGHVALRVVPGSFDQWRKWLDDKKLIELEKTWEPGGRSIYIRDPAGNSIEFVDGQAWP